MIGVYPAAILAPTPVIDWAITIFFPLHSYWGTKEVLSDYLPEIFSTKAVTTTAVYIWTGISVLTFLGLAYLNIYDVGVCKAVAMLWKL
ncbi:Hypothetical predicted protein [Paramuricea clavata]|nr:Hypothetical predicted protein [Paramuricea clavata]